MTKEKFNEIWDHIVLVHSEQLKNLYGDFVIPKRTKRRVYKKYQKTKTFVKTNYMENPKKYLDRHKIAASMMYAIVSVSPVRITGREKWRKFLKNEKFSSECTLLNEYLGFYTAISIIESFREYHAIKEKKLEQLQRIQFPGTNKEGDYVYNTCLDLYLSKKKNKISVLAYANIFFLLEVGNFSTESKNKD